MIQRKHNFYLYFMALILLMGCPMTGSTVPEDMSPKEVAIWANKAYEQQYKAYLQDYEYGRSNPTIQAMLKKKRAVLLEIHPKLMIFNEYIQSGVVPSTELTDDIISLIYTLTGVY